MTTAKTKTIFALLGQMTPHLGDQEEEGGVDDVELLLHGE